MMSKRASARFNPFVFNKVTMRKISYLSAMAFKEGVAYKKDNTEVIVRKDKTVLFKLFGNVIAIKKDSYLFINNCGYVTRTTHDRLNAIFHVLKLPLDIRQLSFQSVLFYEGEPVVWGVYIKYIGFIYVKEKIPTISTRWCSSTLSS